MGGGVVCGAPLKLKVHIFCFSVMRVRVTVDLVTRGVLACRQLKCGFGVLSEWTDIKKVAAGRAFTTC